MIAPDGHKSTAFENIADDIGMSLAEFYIPWSKSVQYGFLRLATR